MNDDDDDEDVFVLCDDTVQKCDFESHVFCGVILTQKEKKRRKKKMRFFLNSKKTTNCNITATQQFTPKYLVKTIYYNSLLTLSSLVIHYFAHAIITRR